MEWNSYKSPEGSENGDEIPIQLEFSSKMMLEHYKQTGDFIQPSSFFIQPEPTLQTKYQSPIKKYESDIEKISQCDQEQSNLYSRKQELQNSGTFMIQTFAATARPAVSQRLVTSNYEQDQTYYKMKQRLEQQYAIKQQNIKKEANELINKFKNHEKFITELIFSMKLVQRLENDIDLMLTIAEQNFEKYKQQLKQKQIETAKKQEQQRKENQKIVKQKERIQAQRVLKQNSFRSSPTKLFRPPPKTNDFMTPRKSINQNVNYGSSAIKKSFIENKNLTQIPISTQQQSPSKLPRTPRTSFAFERRGSYITTSPGKRQVQQISFQESLQQKLQLLSQGRTLKRICFLTQNVQLVDIYCSPDYKRLVCKMSNYDSFIQPMNQFIQVTLGRTSKNFQTFLRPYENTQDGLSFSIVFMRRVIDLQASSQKQRNEFVEALYELRRVSQY